VIGESLRWRHTVTVPKMREEFPWLGVDGHTASLSLGDYDLGGRDKVFSERGHGGLVRGQIVWGIKKMRWEFHSGSNFMRRERPSLGQSSVFKEPHQVLLGW
jgi:hypothetical protein